MIPKSLDWYPKEFRAGDADGKINRSLLGKSELSPLEILVRETAQNSWDARLDDCVPSYSISLRTINGLEKQLSSLLPITVQDRAFSVALDREQLQVIEISDRGTTGLDGPVDMAPKANDSVSKNFEDLIYKVGVPRQDGKGGGTYGFGKTATYSFSEIGTVIFWTRCYNEEGVLEHRFIVSSFREQYIDGDSQYTGRHWWGVKKNNHIYPVQGDAAQELGEFLFESRFVDNQTGTSLLILSPRLESLVLDQDDDFADEEMEDKAKTDEALLDSSEQFKISAKAAIRHHLWPKLVKYPNAASFPMEISLDANGEQIELFDPKDDASLRLWGSALTAVRDAPNRIGQSPVLDSSMISSRVLEVTRNKEVIGYLGLAMTPVPLEDTDILNPSRIARPRINRLALMREQTELIVAHVDWFSSPNEDTLEWAAVFRSVSAQDHLYAESEPPAHDSWNSRGEKPEVRTLVTHTKRKVTQLLNEILGPTVSLPSSSQNNFAKTAAVAKKFAKLLPVAPIDDSVQETPKRKLGLSRTAKQPKPVTLISEGSEYIGIFPRPNEDPNIKFQVNKAYFSLEGSSERARVSLSVSVVGEDSTTEVVDQDILLPRWENAIEVSGAQGQQASFAVPGRYSVTFMAPPRVALRINLSVKEIQ